MACEDPQPTDAEACSMFGLVPCESATGETVCALECPGSGEPELSDAEVCALLGMEPCAGGEGTVTCVSHCEAQADDPCAALGKRPQGTHTALSL